MVVLQLTNAGVVMNVRIPKVATKTDGPKKSLIARIGWRARPG
jgi:hypothetical protein